MAAYLALIRKSDKKLFTGRDLIAVDEMLCEHLGVEPDEKEWHWGWMDTVGLSLAMGKTFDEVREIYLTPELGPSIGHAKAIVDWFEQEFENDSYYGR
jgi:hypothetical protein